MEFRRIGLLIIAGLLFGVVDGDETTATECNPKSCERIDNEKVVCGSDGLTYPNRCLLERVRCVNKNVTLVKRGPCRTQRSCLEWETLSLDFPEYRFKARCKSNGTYDGGQCHPETNYCWCVTPDGMPIQYTARKRNTKSGARPIKCKTTKKMIRSPSRKSRSGLCSVTNKATFNSNLVQTFIATYAGENNHTVPDDVVIKWKFNTLDTNKDGYLDRMEYKDLKKFIKKFIKPKRCSRSFPKSCDINVDLKITFQEWKDCLNRDGVSDVKQNGGVKSEEDEEESEESTNSAPAPVLPGVLSSESNVLSNSHNVPGTESSDTGEELTSCMADRKLALETSDNLYAPECTPDGRWIQVQCYYSVHYCWCANEDTGAWVPGSATKYGKPNCTALRPPPPPIKGCPDVKRLMFLNDLTQHISTNYNITGNATSPANSIALIQTKAEQVAHWTFNYLDKNKTKMLERSEWKGFRELIMPLKNLKKCGKRLPRYCDLNKDREISMTEWLSCFNVHEQFMGALPANIPGLTHSLPSTRAGKKNPLLMLKED